MNKKTILSIQEIASLKSGRRTLEEIIKTHDGTSLGKVRPAIAKYVEEYSLSPFREVGVMSDDKEIYHFQHINNENPSQEELEKLGKTGLHIISTISDDDATDFGAFYPFHGNSIRDYNYMPWKDDLETLFMKNAKGEYIVQSHTTVSPTGQSVTLVKNNNFNDDNQENLKRILKEMNDEIDENNNRIDVSGINHLIMTKYAPRFEEQNIKLRIQSNSNIKQEPPSQDLMDYYEDVERYLYETDATFEDYMEDWGEGPYTREDAMRDYDYGLGGPYWAGD